MTNTCRKRRHPQSTMTNISHTPKHHKTSLHTQMDKVQKQTSLSLHKQTFSRHINTSSSNKRKPSTQPNEKTPKGTKPEKEEHQHSITTIKEKQAAQAHAKKILSKLLNGSCKS